MSPESPSIAPKTTPKAGATLEGAIACAVDWSMAHQTPEGFWRGYLESNCCMEAQWLLAFHVLGRRDDPKVPALLKTLRDDQRSDGAWEVYFDAAAGDINTTVECYAALRAYGDDPQSPHLAKARSWILSHGGLGATRVFTRYWLALIGEWPWSAVPNLPPEIIFLPSFAPFNIYRFACWARATLLPLTLLSAARPSHPLGPQQRLDELFPAGRKAHDYRLPPPKNALQRLFHVVDRLLHGYQGIGLNPGRTAGRRLCLEWIVKHQDADGSWGGIQPPWIYSLMALHQEGYALDHPVLAKGLATLDDHWSFTTPKGGCRIQACESPVWDTLLTLLAFLDASVDPHHPSVARAVDYILDHEVRLGGDWQMGLARSDRQVEPSGWAFERANRWYPDVDDTAVALIVLSRLEGRLANAHQRQRVACSVSRAARWLLALQSKNGGWGAFDKDNTDTLVTQIPFCDFGETLDPPSVDVTAHSLEALGVLGYSLDYPAVASAVAFIRAEQERDGSWFGRWGVNYIYGIGAVVPALAAVGEDMTAPYLQRAGAWLLEHQNPDGGFGESCASYMDAQWRGKGPSTPSQTGWALMALAALPGEATLKALEGGVDYLLTTQRAGTWHEQHYTGTGFPGYGVGARIDLDADLGLAQGAELARGFMLRYHLYRHYFPLMALARAKARLGAA
ncbi:MAG: squalene--hopene cyclase [Candidatus Competibacterales bacterium]